MLRDTLLNILPFYVPGEDLVISFILFGVIASIFDFIAKLIITSTTKLASKTETDLDDMVIDALNKKRKLLPILLAAFLTINLVYGDIALFGRATYQWFITMLVLVGGLILIDVVEALIAFYAKEIAPKTDSKFDDEILPLARNIIKISLYAILIAMVLSQLGVDIAPLLAGLGIGGLAIGLALQDTLANLFAGMHILADKPIRKGEYVKIGDKEGIVQNIGWRTTRIHTAINVEVIIPNKEVANSVILNYSKPDEPTGHLVRFGVAYGSDIDKVKGIFRAVVVQLKNEKLVLKTGDPDIRIEAFGDSSINFVGNLVVPGYPKRLFAEARFFELLYAQFKANSVEIPFPTRTLYIKQEAVEPTKSRVAIKKKK
jgi:small-conductance mechanosensitive channel